jgi:hypothetical protein
VYSSSLFLHHLNSDFEFEFIARGRRASQPHGRRRRDAFGEDGINGSPRKWK